MLALPRMAFAYTITRDPQYIVINLSTINELNWAAPEDEWQQTVKPQVVKAVEEIKRTWPPGSNERKLAWSTLMEYMNFPMDVPGAQSVYAVKMRRILEVAEQENLPVFVPLNGFQWWDELPELYNWWDPDGTHTPAVFFARQKSKDFKERFIRGYNPDNKWNVEWQDFQTPMQLNWRNWGGGGFRLAPPPNILQHAHAGLTYRTVVEERFAAILHELIPTVERWQQDGKEDLFAGISLGTEVSLNASVTRGDEFIPYGYRAVQDLLCPNDAPSCGNSRTWSSETIRQARQDALQSYMFDLSLIARRMGLPKQRVYTHVYADTYSGSPRYEQYADSAFTPFARPGISLYQSATNPLGLPQWLLAMKAQYYPAWGTLEYSAGSSQGSWAMGLANTMAGSVSQAKLLDVYNMGEIRGTGAVPAIASFLASSSKKPPCELPEIIPETPDNSRNPQILGWRYVPEAGVSSISRLRFHFTSPLTSFSVPIQEKIFPLDAGTRTLTVGDLPYGDHDWYIEAVGCSDMKKQFSEPRTIHIERATFMNIIPIDWIIRTLKRLK